MLHLRINASRFSSTAPILPGSSRVSRYPPNGVGQSLERAHQASRDEPFGQLTELPRAETIGVVPASTTRDRVARLVLVAAVALVAGGGAGSTATVLPGSGGVDAGAAGVRFAQALASGAPRSAAPVGSPVVLREADAVYDDSIGDAATGPDIARVSVVDDATGAVGIGVSYGNRSCAAAGDVVFVDLDVDQNVATGTPLGIDLLLFVDIPGNRRGVARWDGSLFQPVFVSSLQAGCEAQGFDYWIFNRTELGIGAGFSFYASACTDTSRAQCPDTAPNGLPLWNYQLSAAPPSPSPPPTPSPPPAPTPPQRTVDDAPRLPKRAAYTGGSIRHTKLASTIYATMKVVGGGRQMQVACWSKGDWATVLADLGEAPTRGGAVIRGFWLPAQRRFLHLAPKVCGDLQALISSRRGNADRARAGTVALHEAAHMYGVGNEAQANCFAVQLVYYFARRLGFSHVEGLRLERLAVRGTRARAPARYWDAVRCRDGGAWDLDEENRNLDY